MKKTVQENPTPEQETPPKRRMPVYLREISVVILGVAVTFIGSGLINRWTQQQDLDRYLEAVRLELEDNLKQVNDLLEFYSAAENFARYLMATPPEEASRDSIERLNHPYLLPAENTLTDSIDFRDYEKTVPLINSTMNMHLKTSAVRMLENSGSLSLIRPKELYQSILDSYTLLETADQHNQEYMRRKRDELFRAALDNSDFYIDILDPRFRRYYYFMGFTSDLEWMFRETRNQLEETLSLLR